jgi:hypothetical protein
MNMYRTSNGIYGQWRAVSVYIQNSSIHQNAMTHYWNGLYQCVLLNSSPNRNGITRNYSPHNIVVGQQIDYNHHCQLEFGTYVQTHEEDCNSMLSRTTGAIALQPNSNIDGYYFMSMTTGWRLNRYNWHVLPMPQVVIDRVHVLACRLGLLFTNRLGDILDDATDDESGDSSYHPSITSFPSQDTIPSDDFDVSN